LSNSVYYSDLGHIDYKDAWDLQTGLQKSLIAQKLKRSDHSIPGPDENQLHYFLFCEHPPVYTLGKGGSEANLLVGQNELDDQEISYYKINRGGDITYHGPGQIVGYPILDLDLLFTDVHKYVRSIEEAIIRTIGEYGLTGVRNPAYTGVWLDKEGDKPARKICAIGIHLSRWVSMHGFALNVNTNLKYFNNIIACGIKDEDKTVTSLDKELGHAVSLDEVKEKIRKHFGDIFDLRFEQSNTINQIISTI